VAQVFTNVMVGATQASKVYVGTVLVWDQSSSSPGDTFTADFRESF
jgi:hypothetical protein